MTTTTTNPTWEIRQGHVIDRLAEMPPESVHCVITSPPYWGLRSYETEPQVWGGGDPECPHDWRDGQWVRRSADDDKEGYKEATNKGSHNRDTPIGFAFCVICDAWRGHLGLEPTPDLFVRNIVLVFREVWRVLRTDGTVWLNVGDGWWGGKGASSSTDERFNRRTDTALAKGYQHVGRKGEPRPQDRLHECIKPKDLIGMPWMVAQALRADGWWLRSPIIWHKPNPMPGSYRDRPTTAHEYMFLLSKSGDATFWTHRTERGSRSKPAPDYYWRNRETLEETPTPPDGWHQKRYCPNSKGKCSLCRVWTRINAWPGHDYYYDNEATANDPTDESKARYDRNPSYGGNGHKPYAMKNRPQGARANLRDVWTIPTESFKGPHYAAYPQNLVRPCILMGTSERGVCGECGAPWGRIVERTDSPHDGETNSGYAKGTAAHRLALARQAARKRGTEYGQVVKTVGWQPTCDHSGPPVPAVVLDPFSGTGTTGVVALQVGRSYIGLELNDEYTALSRKRIMGDAPLFNQPGMCCTSPLEDVETRATRVGERE